MSPSQAILGVVILVGVMVVIMIFGSANKRRHEPDEEELNVIHDEDVHPDSLDK